MAMRINYGNGFRPGREADAVVLSADSLIAADCSERTHEIAEDVLLAGSCLPSQSGNPNVPNRAFPHYAKPKKAVAERRVVLREYGT
jgi:hypothetical protein